MTGMNHGAEIVVINDDAATLQFIVSLLAKREYQVSGYASAELALTHIRNTHVPDLIITDLYMPGIDGWRLCRILRSPEYPEYNTIPVLVVSATYANEEAMHITQEIGADAFLPLPTDHRRLLTVVQSLLSGEPIPSSVSVLVVEDSELQAELLLEIFAQQGYQTVCVGTLSEARELIKRQVPDISVIDYHLADGDGDALIPFITERNPHAAILMMTADPSPELALEWLRQGASAYIRKPFEPNYILRLCQFTQKERALFRVEERLQQRTAELRESESRFRGLYEGVVDAVMIYEIKANNTPGNYTEVNDIACEQLGYSREELLQMTPEEVEIPVSELKAIPSKIAGNVIYECLMQTRDGGLIPAEVHARNHRIGEHDVVFAVIRDLRERRETEERLKAVEIAYHRLVGMTSEGIWSMSAGRTTTFVNPRMASMLGYTVDEMLGKQVEDFMFGSEKSDHGKQMSLRQSGESTRYQRRFRHRDGHLVWTEVTAVPLQTESGDFNGSIALFTDITEKKLAEEALQRSEAQYRALMESTPDIIIRFDREYRFQYISPAIIRYTKHSPESFIGHTCTEVVDDSSISEMWTTLLKEALLTGETIERKLSFTASVGQLVFDCRFIPECDDLNHVMSIMAILRDITEKNKLEKDFQMLFESMVEGFALHEMIYDESGHAIDYRFISVNPAFSQMTGLDPVEIVGKTVHEVLPEIDDAWVQTYEKVVQSGEPARFSKRSENLDRYYDVVAYRTSPGQFATIIRDVSEQKRAEAQMQESEERFRAISEYSHNAICIVNEAGKIIWANENLVDLSGFSREQLLNAESFGQFIAPESMRFVVDNFLKAMRGETYEHHYQFIFLRADGEKRTAEKYMMDIRDRHGHRYLVISILDITDRIRYEEEKRKMQEELTQAQKMESIGRLAGGVAHDFNNMLAIILGYAEMMIGELTEDHPFHEGMQQILEAGRRSRDLTRQLLAFARKQTLEMRRLNINSVIGGFEKMLRRTLRENIRIELCLDPYPCLFHGDVGQIEQVLLNLAVNAQDAMPNGGTLLIETSKTLLEESDAIIQDGGNAGWYLALSITDTGIGMDDETVKRVFDPFFTTKELGRGTGLGLSTVYGIVRQHDGHVSVTSEPGQGTTFRVFLPCVMNGEGESSVTEETAHINTGTETILLAEDQDHVRALAIRLLERKGYNVLAAPDGITARATADATVDPIHLLITDVVMPDMNGRALYESLQVKRPNMRVLYMSGYPADIIGTHGVLEEGVHYIQKPFDISQFLHKVREILDEG